MMQTYTEQTKGTTPFAFRRYSSIKTVDHFAIQNGFLSSQCSTSECERFDELITHTVRIGKGTELYHTGVNSQYLYFVRYGSFKTVLVSEQGCRLVNGFAMSAEPIGLAAITGEPYLCSSVALEDSEVYVISYQRL